MRPDRPGDESLVERLVRDDRAAFDQIFLLYWKHLFHVANARLRSESESEEIVQDIFVALWRNRRTSVITNLSAYLFSAVRKGVISKIRTKLRHREYQQYFLHSFPGYASTTDNDVAFDEVSHAIEEALQKLPEKSQLVFRLNRLEGHSISQISEELNMPRRTIEHHLTQSIRELKLMLKDFVLLLIASAFF